MTWWVAKGRLNKIMPSTKRIKSQALEAVQSSCPNRADTHDGKGWPFFSLPT